MWNAILVFDSEWVANVISTFEYLFIDKKNPRETFPIKK